MNQKEKQEVYETVEQQKKDANASGIDALTRDIRKAGENTVQGAKEAIDMGINDVDDEITADIKKLQNDIDETGKNIKNEVKQDLGIGTTDPRTSRFDKASELTENIKEPEKDDEIYVSRKRQKYMG